MIFNPNPLFYWMLKTYVRNKTPDNKITFCNEGGSRCFAPDQKVITDKGSIKISELKENDNALSFNHITNTQEYKPIICVTPNNKNVKKCIEIRLKNGELIKCTEDHKIFINGRYELAKNVLSLWKHISV